jgi:hypothetical protein
VQCRSEAARELVVDWTGRLRFEYRGGVRCAPARVYIAEVDASSCAVMKRGKKGRMPTWRFVEDSLHCICIWSSALQLQSARAPVRHCTCTTSSAAGAGPYAKPRVPRYLALPPCTARMAS